MDFFLMSGKSHDNITSSVITQPINRIDANSKIQKCKAYEMLLTTQSLRHDQTIEPSET